MAQPIVPFRFASALPHCFSIETRKAIATLRCAVSFYRSTTQVILRISKMFGRRFADLLLFGVTSTELVILFLLTPTFTVTDWIYVLQHLIVLGIALTRPQAKVWDYSIASSVAVGVAYVYPYAQVIYLRWSPGYVAWPAAGLVLVTLGASLSLVSLLTIGRFFGIRPALRGLITSGPYRFIRHPMYLSYVLADIGYNLQEWNFVTLLLVLVGWASLVYRIHAEERVLSQHAEWLAYVALVRYRLVPGLW
jgi:protein-S-isoprenylcysteine O-methyltransferase Ste14